MSRHVTDGAAFRWRHVLAGLAATGACGSLLAAPALAQSPPDGRAYEMVSPVAKYQGGAVYGQRTTPDGNAVAFVTTSAINDESNAFALAPFVAHRTPDGWRTQSAAPIAHAEWRGPSVVKPYMVDYSDDLASVLLKTSDRIDPEDREVMASIPPGVEQTDFGYDLYEYDTTTQAASWLTRPLPLLADEYGAGPSQSTTDGLVYYGASADRRHTVFASGRRMTMDAPAAGMKLYERLNGMVRLVSVLPDGTPAPAVNVVGYPEGQGVRRSSRISADGSRIFWQQNANPRPLYMRENGGETFLLSRNQTTGVPATGQFMGASRDGSIVYFSSQLANLTGGGAGVHRWDRATESFRLVARGSMASFVAAQASEDGTQLYFVTRTRLLPEAVANLEHLYSWNEAEGLKLIGRTNGVIGGTDVVLVTSRDGRYAYFISTDHRRLGERVAEGVKGIYRYDRQSGETVCVSCRADGVVVTSDSVFRPLTSRFAYPANPLDQMPAQLTDDGRLFFQSDEALVGHDINGDTDVYEFDGAGVKLISSGRGDGSAYVDNSADGSSVFFITTNRLVGQDTDGGFPDVYVARVGGGFPEPPESIPGCQGDSCQGPLATPPAFDAPGSTQVTPDASEDDAPPTSATFRLLRPGRRQLRTFAARGRITLGVRVSEPGSVMVEARGRVGRRQRQLGQAWKRAARSGTVRVVVPLNRAAIGRLETGRPLRVRLTVALSGAEATRRLGLRLERPVRRAGARRGTTVKR